ncbi:hypothetical protein KEM55_004801 [Ascosphaera atra]|nr:hypothetical protein KEM55_004801 [Ascosphaera atra]
MVLKPLTQFARQAFSKSIAHGYAQSVVAASQSSYASQTGSQIGHHHHPLSQNSKYPRSAQLQQSAGFSSASASSSSAKPHPGSSESSAAALAAYHAAYQQAQIAEEKKFRKLGWTPLSKEAQAEQDLQQAQLEAEGGKELDSRTSQPGRTSPHNSEHNLLQTDSSSNNVVINADVSARVDEAVAREMRELEERDAEDYNDELPRRKSEAYIAEPERVATLATPLAPFSTLGHHSQPAASPAAAARSEYIVTLALTHQWSRVPSAFESMLDEHLLPTPQAYNALLYAAVRLCVDLHHAVPKALDIYSDMLRRNVLPDAETYQILIPLLASRALACLDQRKLLEQQRLRFGGDSASGRRGGFTLRSSEAEHALLVEDHSLHIVLKLFSTAISRHPDITFTTTLDTKTSETGKNGSSVSDPTPVYTSLINICARTGLFDGELRAL